MAPKRFGSSWPPAVVHPVVRRRRVVWAEVAAEPKIRVPLWLRVLADRAQVG